MKKLKYCFVSLLLLIVLAACGNKSEIKSNRVDIIIAQDFGNEIMSIESFESNPGDTLLDLMDENYEVQTAYGGSFINGIDGLISGFTGKKDRKKNDWFYYVNGILAQIGSGDHELNQEDVIIWDFHDWNNGTYSSSVIGAYPNNFKKNYYGDEISLNILYAEGFKESSENLKKFFMEIGIKDVQAFSMDETILENEATNTIVIGLWDNISQLSYIEKAYKNKEKAGLYFEINKNIIALNQAGNATETYEKGAVIASFLKSYDVMSTLWLVTGNSEEDILKSIDILSNDYDSIKGTFSVLVTGDKILNLPIVSR